ncbi:MAG: hypothetical protein HGA75_14730, partial [Thiobacillus sp.]|nr:hypothetical protein [Thiobacillus sp.]
YGAHLLLQGDERDLDLLREVVGNLEAMLGSHPDVAALCLALARHDGQEPPPGLRFATPPMLARGWQLVVEASLERPELVPGDSFAARVAGNLVSGSHWLIWRRTAALAQTLQASPTAGAADAFATAGEPVIANVLKSMRPVVGRSPMPGHLATLAAPMRIDDDMLAALEALAGGRGERAASLIERVAARFPTAPDRQTRNLTPMQQAVLHEVAATTALPAAERIEQVARSLRLPPATLTATLESLLKPGK